MSCVTNLTKKEEIERFRCEWILSLFPLQLGRSKNGGLGWKILTHSIFFHSPIFIFFHFIPITHTWSFGVMLKCIEWDKKAIRDHSRYVLCVQVTISALDYCIQSKSCPSILRSWCLIQTAKQNLPTTIL